MLGNAHYGGLAACFWDFRAVCGVDEPDNWRGHVERTKEDIRVASIAPKSTSPMKAWNPMTPLREAFGRHAKLANNLCWQWARNNPEQDLQEAVAMACAWAMDVRAGDPPDRQPVDLPAMPPAYVQTSLQRGLAEAHRNAEAGTWHKGTAGDPCPACHGRGQTDRVECETCRGAGMLSKRQWVRGYRVDPEPHRLDRGGAVEDGEGVVENIALAGRSRFNPDERAWHGDGEPAVIVEKIPPPNADVALQRITGYLLSLYLHHIADPVAALAVQLVLLDHKSLRQAAEEISTMTGQSVSYWTVRRKLGRLLGDLRSMWPDEAAS